MLITQHAGFAKHPLHSQKTAKVYSTAAMPLRGGNCQLLHAAPMLVESWLKRKESGRSPHGHNRLYIKAVRQ